MPDLTVRVRVQGSHTHLPHGGRIDVPVPRVFLWFIAADIVNNCNLRCPFCLVDYTAVTKTQLMSDETYQNLLRLVSTVPDGHFYLSCLHEPTLHPRLSQFLDVIPEKSRKKVFFTTNLAKPMKEGDFHTWARSGLHHINISLDTLDPQRFAVLRKFGRFQVFKENLDMMADVFQRTTAAPLVRYITMAFKSNMDEIPTLVRYAREHWLASEHEIRYAFNTANIADEFRRREYLGPGDWAILTQHLHETGCPFVIAYPPNGAGDEKIEPAQNYYESQGPTGDPHRMQITRPIGLRARQDGTILVNGAEDGLRVNINALNDPVLFFRSLVRQAKPRPDGAMLIP